MIVRCSDTYLIPEHKTTTNRKAKMQLLSYDMIPKREEDERVHLKCKCHLKEEHRPHDQKA